MKDETIYLTNDQIDQIAQKVEETPPDRGVQITTTDGDDTDASVCLVSEGVVHFGTIRADGWASWST